MLHTLAIVFLVLLASAVVLEATNRAGRLSEAFGISAVIVATVIACIIVF